MQQAIDDIHIIREVLQGRQSAYAALVDKYRSYVFTLVMRYVNNREVAEELSQDVFVKAYRFLADFKGNSKFSTWLYTIVNTTCLSYLRSGKNEVLLMEEEQIAMLQDSQASQLPYAILEQKSDVAIIAAGMNMLSREDARILYLFYHAE
ncbi:MAG TPA: sigma-70 family RNA polymerase sigma factor [Candidatus Babeliaceae bacterium]|nr:sigma-70 family RNA polymerase sigma factor [Candidatus Babeliaceae bacterium]